jgi:hypothetical protein
MGKVAKVPIETKAGRNAVLLWTKQRRRYKYSPLLGIKTPLSSMFNNHIVHLDENLSQKLLEVPNIDASVVPDVGDSQHSHVWR